MFININIRLKITNKENKKKYFESLRSKIPLKSALRYSLQVVFIGYVLSTVLLGSLYPLSDLIPFGITETVYAYESDQFNQVDYEDLRKENSDTGIEVEKVSLEQKYRDLASYHYYDNVEPYLPIIDRILKQRGLDNDPLFIQAMFFIGQHESHWNTMSISGSSYGGEHPTGIFQFLPSTFRSVSRGDIFDAEDQITAYVAMIEAGRAREYGTLYIPTLNPEAKAYVLSFK